MNCRAMATALLAVAEAAERLEEISPSDPEFDTIARLLMPIITDPGLHDAVPLLNEAVTGLAATRCRIDGRQALLA